MNRLDAQPTANGVTAGPDANSGAKGRGTDVVVADLARVDHGSRQNLEQLDESVGSDVGRDAVRSVAETVVEQLKRWTDEAELAP